jgi:hypothetical protein
LFLLRRRSLSALSRFADHSAPVCSGAHFFFILALLRLFVCKYKQKASDPARSDIKKLGYEDKRLRYKTKKYTSRDFN